MVKTLKVTSITRFRYLFDINPMGLEVSEDVFSLYMTNFPRARRRSYGNADVYCHIWMGNEKWIAMYHLGNGRYYLMEGTP